MTAPLGVQAPAHLLDRFVTDVRGAVPGVLLSVIVALSAFAVRAMPGVGFLSPMILAVIIGAAMRNSGAVPPVAQAGIRFSLRRVLRAAIVLLGFQLTIEQVGAVGISGVAIIAVTLVATFAFTVSAGRILKVDRKLAALIAAGTSICGASAVIAANAVTRAPDEDAAYAVACVTVFGSLSMLIYPLLMPLLPFGEHAYGLWAGASIHEIAQVVAAAFQGGADAGHFGTVAKLSRVMLLAPLVLALGWSAARSRGGDGRNDRGGSHAVPMPWFVFGFVAMVAVNSALDVDPDLKRLLVQVTTFLLTVALAAMGLETDARKLRARGFRPLLLGGAAWIFISVSSFLLIAIAF
jgi:uncharacterized integral membrane protein (TIGR00698 family)